VSTVKKAFKKIFLFVLAIVLMSSMLSFNVSASTVNVTIADTDPVPTIQALINAAIATGATTVTVTGSKITANATLALTIPAGVTVMWNAVYRGVANPVIDYSGEGALNIAGPNGWVQNTSTPNSYTAIRANGNSLIISGGTVQSGKGRAIEGAGPNTVVSVTGGSVFNEATSNLFPVIDMTNASNIGSVNVNVSGGNVYASSTAAGSYGYVIQSYGNVLIGGGTLSTSGVYGRVVNLVGDSSNVTVSGGVVQATGSGGTAISTSTTAPTQVTNTSVTITGGLVASYATSTTGWAIHTTGASSTISVSGGTVFAYGTSITGSTNSAIYTERTGVFTGTSGDGVVIVWNRPAWVAGGQNVYYAPPTTPTTLSSTDIITLPAGAVATWAKRDPSANRPNDGIYYSNGGNTNYIQLPEVTVVNQFYTITISIAPGYAPAGNQIVSTGSGGTITVDYNQPSQYVNVPYNQSQSLTVSTTSPYYIYLVDTWNPDIGSMYFSQPLYIGTTAGETFYYNIPNVISNQIIRVYFAVPNTSQFRLISYAGAGGSISPSGLRVVAPSSVNTYTITAQAGYSISGVVVDGQSVLQELSSTTSWPGTNDLQSGIFTFPPASRDSVITATFARMNQSITATAGAGGSISPPGNVTVPYGNDQRFTITPDEGYFIEQVLVDGMPVSTMSVYDFPNVTGDHTISVTFALNAKPDVYDLSVISGTGGMVSGTQSGYYTQGTAIKVNAIADSGYHFTGWTINGVTIADVSNANLAEFLMPANTVVLTANFEQNPVQTYTLNVISNHGGTVSGTPSGFYAEGFFVSVIATANSGFHFEGWTITGAEITGGEFAKPATFNMPANVVTLTANFEPNPEDTFTLNVIGAVGGTLTGTRSGPYEEGYAVSVTAAANPGYRFVGWTITGAAITGGNNANPAEFFMPENAVTLTAIFEEIRIVASPQTGVNRNIALPLLLLTLGVITIAGAELYCRGIIRKAKQK